MDWGQLVVSIIGGGVGAYFASFLSLKSHYSKHFFEQKVQAYTRILEAIHKMKSANAEEWSVEQWRIENQSSQQNIPEPVKDAIYAKWLPAREEIDRAVDLGSFIMCEEAVTILAKFQKELDAHEPDYVGHLMSVEAAVQSCLSKFRPIARRDLEDYGNPDRLFDFFR